MHFKNVYKTQTINKATYKNENSQMKQRNNESIRYTEFTYETMNHFETNKFI